MEDVPHAPAEVQRLIGLCLDCHATCEATVSHCLMRGGRHAQPAHFRILRDCAQLCLTTADLMLRGSDVFERTCAACEEICRRCADSCDRVDGHDVVMEQCSKICRDCARICAAWGEPSPN
jgi:hypothetical protein